MNDGTELRILFVYGCPRSGTTWVQLLLDRHPAVATAPETHIFSFYLNRLRRQWRHELEGSERGAQGSAGLSRLLSEDEFDEVCRGAAESVLRRIARCDPGASWVVEKSPQHARQSEWIARLFPEALFLHVIRDPRDTVASLLAAGRTWGRDWAPANPVDAARYWSRHVESGRRNRALGKRYREVRFESLEEDAEGELAGILAWLDLPSDEAFCRSAVEACRLDRLRGGATGHLPLPGSRTPEGFFRKGRSGAWRDDLSRTQAGIVGLLCGGLIDELGYERTRTSSGFVRARILAHDALRRVRESVDWQLQRLARLI